MTLADIDALRRHIRELIRLYRLMVRYEALGTVPGARYHGRRAS